MLHARYIGLRTNVVFLFSLIFSHSKKAQWWNQKMADDWSIVCRRRIYYDSVGNEVMICNEGDEEVPELEKRNMFSQKEKINKYGNNTVKPIFLIIPLWMVHSYNVQSHWSHGVLRLTRSPHAPCSLLTEKSPHTKKLWKSPHVSHCQPDYIDPTSHPTNG